MEAIFEQIISQEVYNCFNAPVFQFFRIVYRHFVMFVVYRTRKLIQKLHNSYAVWV